MAFVLFVRFGTVKLHPRVPKSPPPVIARSRATKQSSETSLNKCCLGDKRSLAMPAARYFLHGQKVTKEPRLPSLPGHKGYTPWGDPLLEIPLGCGQVGYRFEFVCFASVIPLPSRTIFLS